MCMRCQGWTWEEIHKWYLDRISTHGWAVLGVEANGRQAGFAYTIGLTRYHDHPELLVSGMGPGDAQALLNDLGGDVALGVRYRSGQLLTPDCGHRIQFVEIGDPGLLIEAQNMYASENGPVPALQVVYTDQRGNWPWQPGWRGERRGQPLFGVPIQT